MNLQQAVDMIQEMESDTEIDIVELPPDRVDQLTDEEKIDEDDAGEILWSRRTYQEAWLKFK